MRKILNAKAAKAEKPSRADAKAAAAAEAAKAAKPEAAKRPTHAASVTAGSGLGSYAEHGGASQSFRGHGRKLSAVILDSNPGSVSERDTDFLRDLRTAYNNRPFQRLDCDAGNLRRGIANGHICYVSGGNRTGNTVSGRDATFQLTAAGIAYGKPV